MYASKNMLVNACNDEDCLNLSVHVLGSNAGLKAPPQSPSGLARGVLHGK